MSHLDIHKLYYPPAQPVEKQKDLYMIFHCEDCGKKLRVSHPQYGFGMVCPHCKAGLICPSPSFHVGEKLGHFQIDGWVAKGSMGEVYYARSGKSGRVCALKVLNSSLGEESIKLFDQEAEVLRVFTHPSLPRLIAHQQDRGYRYTAMTYFEGESIDRLLIRESALSEELVLNMMAQVANGLNHVWRNFGLLHFDIKPANIMLCDNGFTGLVDWGMARTWDHTQVTGVAFGTPFFMDPMRFTQTDLLDYRSDMYSLAASFFQALTGQVPYFDLDTDVVVDKALTEPVPSLIECGASVTERTDALFRKMMAKTADERYLTWEEVIEEISAILDDLGSNTWMDSANIQAAGLIAEE